MNMSKIIKFKNGKRSFFTIPYVPGPKLLGGTFGGNIRRDVRLIKFLSKLSYYGTTQDGLSILFGYKIGRNEKVYLGWRYSKVSNSADIYLAYVLPGDVYTERFLLSAELNKAYIMTLEIDYSTSKITVLCETALDKGYRMHVTLTTGGMGSSCGIMEVIFPKWCISSGLLPTLGNIKSCPQEEIKIKIERI